MQVSPLSLKNFSLRISVPRNIYSGDDLVHFTQSLHCNGYAVAPAASFHYSLALCLRRPVLWLPSLTPPLKMPMLMSTTPLSARPTTPSTLSPSSSLSTGGPRFAVGCPGKGQVCQQGRHGFPHKVLPRSPGPQRELHRPHSRSAHSASRARTWS